jgi:excisionase family DNA binding protein
MPMLADQPAPSPRITATDERPTRTAGPETTAHPLMTVSEVARALRVSEMTVRRAIHAQTIPSVAVGRAYRIPRAYVTRVLDEASADHTDGGAQ